jgi:hypothetical protein
VCISNADDPQFALRAISAGHKFSRLHGARSEFIPPYPWGESSLLSKQLHSTCPTLTEAQVQAVAQSAGSV